MFLVAVSARPSMQAAQRTGKHSPTMQRQFRDISEIIGIGGHKPGAPRETLRSDQPIEDPPPIETHCHHDAPIGQHISLGNIDNRETLKDLCQTCTTFSVEPRVAIHAAFELNPRHDGNHRRFGKMLKSIERGRNTIANIDSNVGIDKNQRLGRSGHQSTSRTSRGRPFGPVIARIFSAISAKSRRHASGSSSGVNTIRLPSRSMRTRAPMPNPNPFGSRTASLLPDLKVRADTVLISSIYRISTLPSTDFG